MLVKAVFVVIVLLAAIAGIYFLFEKFFYNDKKFKDMEKDVAELKNKCCSECCSHDDKKV